MKSDSYSPLIVCGLTCQVDEYSLIGYKFCKGLG